MWGPKDTSYKDGIFVLKIVFPYNYPEEKPEIFFLTPIYHVNINPENYYPGLGFISISSLYNWNHKYYMKQILLDIFALLFKGNPNKSFSLEMRNEMISRNL